MRERPTTPCGAYAGGSAEAANHQYRDEVLAELEKHGVRPRPSTPPALVAEFVNDLYRYELRRLRDGVVRKTLPPRDLSARVLELRRKYPLVSLPVRFWTEPTNP